MNSTDQNNQPGTSSQIPTIVSTCDSNDLTRKSPFSHLFHGKSNDDFRYHIRVYRFSKEILLAWKLKCDTLESILTGFKEADIKLNNQPEKISFAETRNSCLTQLTKIKALTNNYISEFDTLVDALMKCMDMSVIDFYISKLIPKFLFEKCFKDDHFDDDFVKELDQVSTQIQATFDTSEQLELEREKLFKDLENFEKNLVESEFHSCCKCKWRGWYIEEVIAVTKWCDAELNDSKAIFDPIQDDWNEFKKSLTKLLKKIEEINTGTDSSYSFFNKVAECSEKIECLTKIESIENSFNILASTLDMVYLKFRFLDSLCEWYTYTKRSCKTERNDFEKTLSYNISLVLESNKEVYIGVEHFKFLCCIKIKLLRKLFEKYSENFQEDFMKEFPEYSKELEKWCDYHFQEMKKSYVVFKDKVKKSLTIEDFDSNRQPNAMSHFEIFHKIAFEMQCLYSYSYGHTEMSRSLINNKLDHSKNVLHWNGCNDQKEIKIIQEQYKDNPNEMDQKLREFVLERFEKYEEITKTEIKLNGRAKCPYNKYFGKNLKIKLSAHHIIPCHVLNQFVKNILKRQDSYLLGELTKVCKEIERRIEGSGVKITNLNTQTKEELDLKFGKKRTENKKVFLLPKEIKKENFYVVQPDDVYYLTLFNWLTGNIIIGPMDRSDDPGREFEKKSINIVGEENYKLLKKLYMTMLALEKEESNQEEQDSHKFYEPYYVILNSIREICNFLPLVYEFNKSEWTEDETTKKWHIKGELIHQTPTHEPTWTLEQHIDDLESFSRDLYKRSKKKNATP